MSVSTTIVSLLLLSIAAPISQVFAEPLFCQSGTCTHNAPTVWKEFPATEWGFSGYTTLFQWPVDTTQPAKKLIDFPHVLDVTTKETTILECPTCAHVHAFPNQLAVFGTDLDLIFIPYGLGGANQRYSIGKHNNFECNPSDVTNWGKLEGAGSYAEFHPHAIYNQNFGEYKGLNDVYVGGWLCCGHGWPSGGRYAASSLNVHADFTNGVFLTNSFQTIAYVRQDPADPANFQIQRLCGVRNNVDPAVSANTVPVDGLCASGARLVSLNAIAIDAPSNSVYFSDGPFVRKIDLSFSGLSVSSPWQSDYSVFPSNKFNVAQGNNFYFSIHSRRIQWNDAANNLYSLDLTHFPLSAAPATPIPAASTPLDTTYTMAQFATVDPHHILVWYGLLQQPTEQVQRLTLIAPSWYTAPTPAAPTVDFCNGPNCEYSAAAIGQHAGDRWLPFPGGARPTTHILTNNNGRVITVKDNSFSDGFGCTGSGSATGSGCNALFINTAAFIGDHVVLFSGALTHVDAHAKWLVARHNSLSVAHGFTDGNLYGKLYNSADEPDYDANNMGSIAFGTPRDAHDLYFGDKSTLAPISRHLRSATTERWAGHDGSAMVTDPTQRTVYIITPTITAGGDNDGLQVERFCGVHHNPLLAGARDFQDGCCEKTASFLAPHGIAIDEAHAWIGDRGVLRRIVLATKTVITTHGWTKELTSGAHPISGTAELHLSVFGNTLSWHAGNDLVYMMDTAKASNTNIGPMDPVEQPALITAATGGEMDPSAVQVLGVQMADRDMAIATMRHSNNDMFFFRLKTTRTDLCGVNDVQGNPCGTEDAICDFSNEKWLDLSDNQCKDRTTAAACNPQTEDFVGLPTTFYNEDNYCKPKCNFHLQYLVGSTCTARTDTSCTLPEVLVAGDEFTNSYCQVPPVCPAHQWDDNGVCRDPKTCNANPWNYVKTAHTATTDAICGHRCCDTLNDGSKPYTETCAFGATNCCSDLPNHEFPWNTHFYDTTASQCKTRQTTTTCQATFTNEQDPLVFLHAPSIADANRPTLATKCGYPTACGCDYNTPQCTFWATRYFVNTASCPTRRVNGDCSSHQEVLPATGALTIANAQADSICINKCCSEAGLTPSASCDPWTTHWLSGGVCTARTTCPQPWHEGTIAAPTYDNDRVCVPKCCLSGETNKPTPCADNNWFDNRFWNGACTTRTVCAAHETTTTPADPKIADDTCANTCASHQFWDGSTCQDAKTCNANPWNYVKTAHTTTADAICGHRCCDTLNDGSKPYTETCGVGATNCCSDLPNHEFPWNAHYYDTSVAQCKTRETTTTCQATFTNEQDPLVFLHAPSIADANRPTMATKCGYPTACGCGYDTPLCSFWATRYFVSSTNCPTRTSSCTGSEKEVYPAAADLTIANAQANSMCINKCCGAAHANQPGSTACDPWASWWLNNDVCTARTTCPNDPAWEEGTIATPNYNNDRICTPKCCRDNEPNKPSPCAAANWFDARYWDGSACQTRLASCALNYQEVTSPTTPQTQDSTCQDRCGGDWTNKWYDVSAGTCKDRTTTCPPNLVLTPTTLQTQDNACINNCLSSLRTKRCKYGPLPASECINTGNAWNSPAATCRDIYDAQKAQFIDQHCFSDAERAQMNYFLNDVCSPTAPKKECRLTPTALNNKIPPSGVVSGWTNGPAGKGTTVMNFDVNADLAATQPAGDQDKPYGYRLLVFPDKRDPIKANLFSTISQMRTNLLGTNPTGEAALIQDMEFTDVFWSSVAGSDTRFAWVAPTTSCGITYTRELTLADDCDVVGTKPDGSPKYACKLNAYNLWPQQTRLRQSSGTDKWTISPPQQVVTGPDTPVPGSAQTVSLDIAGGTSSEGSLTIADFSCKMNVDFEVVCQLENAGAADWRVADFSVVANSQFKIETPTNVATTWIQDTIGSRRVEGPENRFSIKTLPVTQTGTYVVQFNIKIAPQANPTALANVLLKVTLLMTGQTNLQYVTAALTQPDADRVYGPHDVLTIDFASPNGDHYVNLQQIYMKNAIGNFIYADRSVAAADDYFKITCNPTGQTATTQQCTFLPGGGANTNPLFYEHPPFVIGADVAIAPTARRQRQQSGSDKTNPSRDRGYLGQININVSATNSNAAPQQQRTSSTSSSGFFTARNKILIAAIAGALVVITVAVIVAVVLVRRSASHPQAQASAEETVSAEKPATFTALDDVEDSAALPQSDLNISSQQHNESKYLAESDCFDLGTTYSAPTTPRDRAVSVEHKDENEA